MTSPFSIYAKPDCQCSKSKKPGEVYDEVLRGFVICACITQAEYALCLLIEANNSAVRRLLMEPAKP